MSPDQPRVSDFDAWTQFNAAIPVGRTDKLSTNQVQMFLEDKRFPHTEKHVRDFKDVIYDNWLARA